MKFSVLSSGSKGNTTYIETKETRILIDAGNCCKYILDTLEKLQIDPHTIDAILITHTHSDHIKGLPVLLKKINPCVYISKKMYEHMEYLENYKIINSNKIKIKDIDIDVIKTSHDTEESFGFILNNNEKSIVYITDTGYINQRYFNNLKNRNVYIMESNHDIEMLNNSSYPFELRQRILSDKGHLSNYDSAKYLSKFIGTNTKYILLAHLSEENNTKELAYNELIKRLEKEKLTIPNIIVTSQNKETELIDI